jgi:hypothetical protein
VLMVFLAESSENAGAGEATLTQACADVPQLQGRTRKHMNTPGEETYNDKF